MPLLPPFSADWSSWVNENIDDFDINKNLPECLVRDITFTDYRGELDKLKIKGLLIRGTKEGAMLKEEDTHLWSNFQKLSHYESDTDHDVYSSLQTIKKVSIFILDSLRELK